MTDSRFRSLNDDLRERFGEKLYKLTLNGGCTCPNRDGTLGTRGCIFCSEGGSGEFAASPQLSIQEQIEDGKRRLAGKRPVKKYIAYFQAYTNTYAPVEHLRRVFTEAISCPEIAVLSIATRPDCLGEEVLELLEELNRRKPVWVELAGHHALREQYAGCRHKASASAYIKAYRSGRLLPAYRFSHSDYERICGPGDPLPGSLQAGSGDTPAHRRRSKGPSHCAGMEPGQTPGPEHHSERAEKKKYLPGTPLFSLNSAAPLFPAKSRTCAS